MPANLTPQYHKAESQYRAAQTPSEELECLQIMLREIPKHKGTDKLQAELKAKIAKVKVEAAKPVPKTGKPSVKIPRQGAGRVLLIGPPNCGKSQLLASLTNATPEIADYPFTTQSPQLGMMHFEDCPLQLIDLPPISADFFDNEVLNLVRGADLVLLVIDLGNDSLIEDTQFILERFSNGKTRFGRESELDEDDIGTTYTRTLVVFNKADAPDAEGRFEMLTEYIKFDFDFVRVSATTRENLESIPKEVFSRLELVRVYTQNPREKKPDLTKPFTIRRGETLVEVAMQIHRDFGEKLQSARVWGSAVHDGTVVKPEYTPQDRDIVELNIKS